MQYDKEDVRQSAAGHWQDILTHFCPHLLWNVRSEGPCPKCGGETRWRLLDGGVTGASHCHVCFTEKNGDGIATLQWLLDTDFNTTVNMLGEHLNLTPVTQPKPKQKRASLVPVGLPLDEFGTWYSHWMASSSSIEETGAYVGQYTQGSYDELVLAIPIIQEKKTGTNVVMLPLAADGMLPTKDGMVKKKIIGKGGLCICDRGTDLVLKVEGVTDFLAAVHKYNCTVFTTACGASQKPTQWMLDWLAGKNVVIVGDCDVPGEKGAKKWFERLSSSNISAHLVALPYPREEKSGKDLRDFLKDYPDASLKDYIQPREETSETIAKTPIEMDPYDPHAVATTNLKSYWEGHNRVLRYYRDQWWKWDGSIYRVISDTELEAKVWAATVDYFGVQHKIDDRGEDYPRHVTNSTITNVVKAMRSLCLVNATAQMPCWVGDDASSRPSTCITVDNGILDVDAHLRGEKDCLIPPTPDWFSPNTVGYNYDPDAKCEFFTQFLEGIFDLELDRKAWQEWCGYCLVPETWLQKAMLLIGEGSNGKSSLMASMEALIGEQNVAACSLESLNDKYTAYSLVGKLVNMCSDFGSANADLSEGVIKNLIHGDPVNIDRKYKESLKAVLPCRFVLATNNQPRWKDKTEGMWRSWHYLVFTKQFKKGQGDFIPGLSDAKTWKDMGEMPGILNWALAGLARIRKSKQISESCNAQIASKEYREEVNPVLQFLSENYESANDEHYVECQEAYNAYRFWCTENGFKPVNSANFGKDIRRQFCAVERKKKIVGTVRKWCYCALAMKRTVEFI